VPTDASIEQRFDQTSTEEIGSGAEAHGTDDDPEPDRAAARRSLLPSSLGLSFLVPADTTTLDATVHWGDYLSDGPAGQPEPVLGEENAAEASAQAENGGVPAVSKRWTWQRIPCTRNMTLSSPERTGSSEYHEVPDSGGLKLCMTVRDTGLASLPAGVRAISLFLVNARKPEEDYPYRSFIFQAGIKLYSELGFIPRPDPRGGTLEDEWDHRVADLQYRDSFEFAVGHGVSVAAEHQGGQCQTICTDWLPWAEVERVEPAQIKDVELDIEALGQLKDVEDAKAKLEPLVDHYIEWIELQRQSVANLNSDRGKTATDMLQEAEVAACRIRAGIGLLADPDTLEAFRIANRVIARSARQRFGVIQGIPPEDVAPPRWRPFQLAYLLMTIRGIVEPAHADRNVVDLLFFPTGGGKTEAYLALSAFTLVLRRLKSKDEEGVPTIGSSGISVLMRYTLRLLTLDQLSRAAGLICALELEREGREALLGSWPFEIGLWVGQAATPNYMGHRGDNSSRREYSAYTKVNRFQRDDRQPSPIPLEECPWCGTKFSRNSFRLVPYPAKPLDLRVHCANHECAFSGDRVLPIVAVDEPIYRRLPCFLIATVDKFAALPWTGETGCLFGKVDRYDKDGFYGPCTLGVGSRLPGGQLPPPDLIIQDELHLISGPLGTVAGLYEAVIDALSTRTIDGAEIRPKIIASTATVRRADSQICALFGRKRVKVFPPPGPDRKDSFFAITEPSENTPARLYLGVAAQGRSLKVILLRTALALLSAGQRVWEEAGALDVSPNPCDPYMTLLGYFNSLRELGGSRRIIEDEVKTRLAQYGKRKRISPNDGSFVDRNIGFDVLELTSRVSTNDVAAAKRRLALGFREQEKVDVALATNMISVGLDITRLGLMVVLGQPKTSSEYIQSTSRVGRDPNRPGLVVTLLNIHKPRDRSHYERFTAYHESFYRTVEATSVTPFSPRALDRALSAALVAYCRHSIPSLTPPRSAADIGQYRSELDQMAEGIATRAKEHRVVSNEVKDILYENVLHRCRSLLDDWVNIAERARTEGSAIQYQRESSAPPRRLLYEFLHPDLANLHPVHSKFRANRSMRDVEAPVDITVKNLNDWGERP
jgi:hypothetical protein